MEETSASTLSPWSKFPPRKLPKQHEDIDKNKKIYKTLYPSWDNFRKDFKEPRSPKKQYRTPFIQGTKFKLCNSISTEEDNQENPTN
jgi:hypothetical protein